MRRVLTALFVGALLACGFPDVRYTDDATATDAGPTDAEVLVDGKPPLPDSSDVCDRDGDQSKANNRAEGGMCGVPEAAVGTYDCDDSDSRAYPGELYNGDGYRTDVAVDPTYGDWNCDGNPERRYKVNFTCPSVVTLGFDCTTLEGDSRTHRGVALQARS